MVIKMYDLDGKEIKIVTDDEIENNKIDDLEDTIDFTQVIEEIKENG